jgi:predicted PurR-regulated permease PerM
MEFLYLTIVAIVIYFASDRLLMAIERYLGRTLEQRSVVFFGILLVLLLVSFAVIRQFLE